MVILTNRKQRVLSFLRTIVDTHFRDTFFISPIQPSPTSLWAQFMYYIIFYYFKYDLSSCDLLGEIEKVWFGGYGSVPFEPFAWAQLMHATKWERDIDSTSGSWRRSCTWKFHLKTAFMLWVTVAQFSNLLHEPSLCMLPSEKRTLVAPLAHKGGLVPKIFTSK